MILVVFLACPSVMTAKGLKCDSTGKSHPVYPEDSLTSVYKRAAQYILSQTGRPNKGYCLVFGAGEGRLAYELAVHSDFKIIGVETDSSKVNSGRTILSRANLYGNRITLQEGSLSKLDCRDYAASLVVSDSIIAEGACSGSAAEMFRMVRPDGGIALIGQPSGCPKPLDSKELRRWLDAGGLTYKITNDSNGIWARIDRGPLPGAGEWTHTWADLGNTACSGDTRITDSWKVLWFGELGPRVITDRHWRPNAPLYKAGKLITPGDNRIICSDAYNGARLWELRVPNSSRVAILRDSGWVAVDNNHVYIAAEDDCLKVNLDTGQVEATYHPPSRNRDWGYLGVENKSNLLFGSEQNVGASRLATSYYELGKAGNQISRGDGQPIVTSRALFCRDKNTGSLLWRYNNSNGLGGNEFVIANPTICVSEDAVYFFESYDSNAVADADSRIKLDVFTNGSNEYLVKLDKNTGRILWRRQHNVPFYNIMYLSYAKGIILASGSTTAENFWYHYRAYKAGDGSLAWEKNWDSSWPGGDKTHGGQDRHPMIIGDNVYLRFGSYNLRTGESIGFTFNTARKCADCSASATHIFGRQGNYGFSGAAGIYNLKDDGSGSPLCSAARPGCYISIIPAGGVIMLPAYSAGCTCAFTLLTSIAWLPQ